MPNSIVAVPISSPISSLFPYFLSQRLVRIKIWQKDVYMINFKQICYTMAGGDKNMPKVIEAIYENGVFKPLEKVDIEEHKKIKIILPSKIEYAPSEECTLEGIIDIAKDCFDTDLSTHHDRYLYGEISR